MQVIHNSDCLHAREEMEPPHNQWSGINKTGNLRVREPLQVIQVYVMKWRHYLSVRTYDRSRQSWSRNTRGIWGVKPRAEGDRWARRIRWRLPLGWGHGGDLYNKDSYINVINWSLISCYFWLWKHYEIPLCVKYIQNKQSFQEIFTEECLFENKKI